MIRRPPRSTQSRSSAASDVYKRQVPNYGQQKAYDLKLHLKVYHYRQTDYKTCFFFRCSQRSLSGLKFLGALPKSPTNSLAFSFFVDGLEISFSKCSSTILDILVSFC